LNIGANQAKPIYEADVIDPIFESYVGASGIYAAIMLTTDENSLNP
jgi:hypothetical protein